MPIPPFTKDGLLPPGFHSANMAEFERQLGFSPKRRFLIEKGLKVVARELLGMRFKRLYVGGSFGSAKPFPDDVDGYVVTRLDSESLPRFIEKQEEWKSLHLVDIYPAFEDIEGEGSKTYWEQWFGHTADEPPKRRGIIELALGG